MKITRMLTFVVLGLATTISPASADQLPSKTSASKKTYPISRFLTSRLNPMSGFGLKRFIGARGLLGRLKAGKVTGNDRRSIRRILMGTGLSKSEADAQSRSIIAKAKSGELAGGRKYRISRFFTSRKWQGIVTGVSATLNFLTFGLATAVSTGVKAGLLAAGGVHLDRVIVARGLAGRLALGKRLMVSENRLLERLAMETQLQPIETTRLEVDPAMQVTEAVQEATTADVDPVAVTEPVAPSTDIVMAADGYPGAVPGGIEQKPSFFKKLFRSGPLTPRDALPSK